ncbi:uncharacterized protein LOC121739074 [Aricia agestis]|uniref:uncharacterized protein LOC121739074 n=1 Tax=Aricia agestis TaxID=91739 RepID=UPI001C20899F|nr:uncharacterized protein LOC121739074 [Aricia agestis]
MGKVKEHVDEDVNWQSNIEKRKLNDDNWNVKVIMIEASEIEQENMYLKEFEKGAEKGNRFVIKNISKIETLFMIKQLGGQNKTPRVFMEAQSHLKDNKSIPPEILALIIKHLILTMKDEYSYVVQQKLAVSEGLKNESEIMINKAEIKKKVDTRNKKSADSSSAKHKSNVEKKSSSNIIEADESKKYHTLLRIRGEEWRDKEYLEDFPEEGPNLYVALTGFTEPYLPGCLIRIGVPLIAIVKLVIDPKTVRTPSRLSKNIKSDTDLSKKCRMFWEGLKFCRSGCDRYILKNTAMIVFSPSLFDEDINVYDPDVIVNNQEKIYNELCYLMYDLQDLTRQHAHFLNNFEVTLVPDEKPNERLQRDYLRVNNKTPLDSATVYSILDSMLETVSITDTLKETYHDKVVAKNYAMKKKNSLQAETFIAEVFCKLRNTDVDKKEFRVTERNEFENDNNPTIIHFGDRLRYNTFHLGECNLQDAVRSTLQGLPVVHIWHDFEKLSGKNQARINFHINLLSSFFDRKLEIPELTRLIQILNCTKLYNSRDKFYDQNSQFSSKNYNRRLLLKRSLMVEPLAQDSMIKTANFNSPLHQKLIQLTNHDIQILSKEKSVQESLSQEEWRGHIATPICLQDFFEFVLDEKYDWIQNEEKLYELRMNKTATKVTKEKKKIAVPGCCDDIDEFDLLMESSLKQRDLDSFFKSSPEAQESVIKDFSMTSSKLHSRISILSRLSRRSKMLEPFLTSSESSVEESLQEIFYGYDLSDRRVEAIGKNSVYFSKDGSIITTKYTSFLHSDSKYLSLSIVVDKNEFWIHRIVGGATESAESRETFRISTKDDISLSVKKQIHSETKYESTNISTDGNKNQRPGVVDYTLQVVWPNGLITETVKNNSNTKISYIRQSFSLSLPDSSEDKRCISMHGEVIIFKKNGNIEVLQPAGAYIIISRYETKTKSELDAEKTQYDEMSSGKYNKNIEKHNRKEGDAQNKQPDHKIQDDGRGPSRLENIDSELIFHEYETVDCSGLRQKWTQDVLLEERKLLSRTASDYYLGEVLTKRSDGTIIFLNKDGDLVTTYPNKTRITTSYIIESEDIYPEYSVYELDFNEQIIINKDELYLSIQIVYTIEHPDYSTVIINRSNNSTSIESPNKMLLTLTHDNDYDVYFDDNTSASFSGELLKILSNRIHRENVCIVDINCNIKDHETSNDMWLRMKDSFENDIIVDSSGEISVTESDVSKEREETVQETSLDEWKRLQEAKAVKFFILKRDLSCAELVHGDLVKKYEKTISDTKWSSSKVYKSFGDNRNLLSIVTPIQLTASEVSSLQLLCKSLISNKFF